MQVVIYLFDDFTPLEVFGPYNLFTKFPNVDVKLVAEKKGMIYTDNKAIGLQAKYSIKDITSADILFIPGSAIGWTQQVNHKPVLNWIRQINKTTQYTVATCSGPLILASAGLLSGKKATAFWRVAELLTDYNVTYVNQPIVQDGKFLTANGVSASMDMALLLGKVMSDEENVKITQLLLAYESKNTEDLTTLFQDERLVNIANDIIIDDAKNTLSILNKIFNAKLLLRIRNSNLNSHQQ